MGIKSNLKKVKRDNSKSNNISSNLVVYLYEKGHSPITTRFKGYGLAECDTLSISNSEYIYEYEIKISKADFKKDFIKEKHSYIKSGNYVVENKKGIWYNTANYFYFVVPENLISVEDIPEYAGLMYSIGNTFVTIKKAPLLHKTKATTELIRAICHQLTTKLVFNKII